MQMIQKQAKQTNKTLPIPNSANPKNVKEKNKKFDMKWQASSEHCEDFFILCSSQPFLRKIHT